MNNYYIFTEIVGCGKIGKIALDSFHAHHNLPVHIYGTAEDFTHITPNSNNTFIEISEAIKGKFAYGHVGTASLWAEVIRTVKTEFIIHFDSDTIFRESIVDDMITKSQTYDIIGPRRNYHHNPNNRTDVRHLTDICQTNCILFNTKKIGNFNQQLLTLSPFMALKRIKYFIKNSLAPKAKRMDKFTAMIHGTYSPFSFSVIDFFDPIMFNMVLNGARIYHLEHYDVGGFNYYGSRDNVFSALNNFPTPYKIDFGKKLSHFSCVGSGMNFYKNPESQKNVDQTYVTTALDRYALFCKIFYNETIPNQDLSKYTDIIKVTKWY